MSDIAQRTPAWFEQRLGCATASRISEIVARTKTGYSTSRANYCADLVVERITLQPVPTYSNAAMQYGIDVEPQARAAFAFMQNVEVTEVGFVKHPTIAWSGASPDGFIGDDGLIEIKCPYQTAVHIETLLGDGAAPDIRHVRQILWQLACTGRRFCLLVSFDGRVPPPMQMHMTRIVRDDEQITILEKEVAIFLAEVDAKVNALTEKYLKAAA